MHVSENFVLSFPKQDKKIFRITHINKIGMKITLLSGWQSEMKEKKIST